MTNDQKPPLPPENKSISISGDVRDSNVIIGDNNTVNQTIIQKFFNIFKSDTETLEQRNRRILLNHVENAWIKGVLDASLHGAAMLDLGIKQDPEAVTQYPWAIQKESTKETLPAGTSMLEIFDSIGMGRSLLILGAPGSGKTTMLLELARGLIARAREDVTQPIPMVFNLASWTEKLNLADWLAQELNNLYSVPRKTAPDWVKGNKLLLLLDGLDEVRQDSRAKCVEAINEFRKQNGMTSLAVCSRSQDYADLKAKLSFEGAIEVQPLTQEQINEFFNHFGDEMAGIKQALEKDSALREMAETPLFLSIMLMAYRDKRYIDILVSKDKRAQHKHLFDTYIEHMFKRSDLLKAVARVNHDVKRWLNWLAQQMISRNAVPFFIESIQPDWLHNKKFVWQYKAIVITGFGLIFCWGSGLDILISSIIFETNLSIYALVGGCFIGILIGLLVSSSNIPVADRIIWSWKIVRLRLLRRIIYSLGIFLLVAGIFGFTAQFQFSLNFFWGNAIAIGLRYCVFSLLIFVLADGLQYSKIENVFVGQKILLSMKNSLLIFAVIGLLLSFGYYLLLGAGDMLDLEKSFSINFAIGLGLAGGLAFGVIYGGATIVGNYALRFVFSLNNLLPWRLVPFLDHCVDLIFLRRVGGGYIFIHRLLMEHFAEMYVESPTPKGN